MKNSKVHNQIDNAFDSIVDCLWYLLYMFLSLIYQGCLSGFFELLLLDVQVKICTVGATYIKVSEYLLFA